MKVLVLNCGSSSIKYQLRDSGADSVEAGGLVSRIGEEESRIDGQTNGNAFSRELPIEGHGRGLEVVVETLLDSDTGVLRDISEVGAVGHRVVHGGSHFSGATLITPEVLEKMSQQARLAPLHNPPILLSIHESLRILPGIPQVAVFDTSFHSTLPPRAYLYAIPYRFYTDHEVRRYGFHGTSFASVAKKTGRLLDGDIGGLKMVIAHLGNGASVAAIDGGESVDTSMGLTPLEGLVMGTRPGDVDPGVMLYLLRDLGIPLDEVDGILNKESGLLGLSGVSNDMRDVEAGAAGGDERCRLALDVYAYRVKKYVGAYAAAMGGLDVLVFTAGVGENDAAMRSAICDGLGFLGIELDPAVNDTTRAVARDISTPRSRVRVLVVPTDEEGMIAEQTVTVVENLRRSRET